MDQRSTLPPSSIPSAPCVSDRSSTNALSQPDSHALSSDSCQKIGKCLPSPSLRDAPILSSHFFPLLRSIARTSILEDARTAKRGVEDGMKEKSGEWGDGLERGFWGNETDTGACPTLVLILARESFRTVQSIDVAAMFASRPRQRSLL